MRKLVLHIGRHKTGTTAIQHFLWDNRKMLLDSGYYIPTTGRVNAGHHGLVRPLLPRNSRNQPLETLRELPNYQKLREELEKVGPFKKVLITSEAFQNCKAPVVRAAFRDYDASIIVFLRNHLEYLASSYVQRVQATDYSGSLRDYYENHHRAAVSYYAFLEAWNESFAGKMSVRRYRAGSAVEDFCELLLPGGAEGFERRSSHSNPSLNQKVAAFKLELNRRKPSDMPSLEDMYFPLTALNDIFPAPKFTVPEEIREQLLKDKMTSENKTAEKYFGERQLFDYSDYDCSPEPTISDAEFREMYAALKGIVARRAAPEPSNAGQGA